MHNTAGQLPRGPTDILFIFVAHLQHPILRKATLQCPLPNICVEAASPHPTQSTSGRTTVCSLVE